MATTEEEVKTVEEQIRFKEEDNSQDAELKGNMTTKRSRSVRCHTFASYEKCVAVTERKDGEDERKE